MFSWNYPAIIVVAVVVGVSLGAWLIRLAEPRRVKIKFECVMCGRKELGPSAKDWRFCPYCGASKNAKSLQV